MPSSAASARVLAGRIDRLGRGFESTIAAALSRAEALISADLTRLELTGRGTIRVSARNARRIRLARLDRIMGQAGVLGAVRTGTRSAPLILMAMRSVLEDVGATNLSASMLRSFTVSGRRQLEAAVTALSADINRTLRRSILAGHELSEAMSDVRDLIDRRAYRLRLGYEIMLTETVQASILTSNRSEPKPDDVFEYVGPVPGARPFCLRHVGRVWTRTYINNANNGQLPNVMLTRGGFNCRHIWVPVDRDDPRIAAADTGNFINSGVAAAVSRTVGTRGGS